MITGSDVVCFLFLTASLSYVAVVISWIVEGSDGD